MPFVPPTVWHWLVESARASASSASCNRRVASACAASARRRAASYLAFMASCRRSALVSFRVPAFTRGVACCATCCCGARLGCCNCGCWALARAARAACSACWLAANSSASRARAFARSGVFASGSALKGTSAGPGLSSVGKAGAGPGSLGGATAWAVPAVATKARLTTMASDRTPMSQVRIGVGRRYDGSAVEPPVPIPIKLLRFPRAWTTSSRPESAPGRQTLAGHDAQGNSPFGLLPNRAANTVDAALMVVPRSGAHPVPSSCRPDALPCP